MEINVFSLHQALILFALRGTLSVTVIAVVNWIRNQFQRMDEANYVSVHANSLKMNPSVLSNPVIVK